MDARNDYNYYYEMDARNDYNYSYEMDARNDNESMIITIWNTDIKLTFSYL